MPSRSASTTVCDSSGAEIEWTVGFFGSMRLREEGAFEDDFDSPPGEPFTSEFHVDGAVHFRTAEGNWTFSYPSFDAMHQPETCTSGDVSWTADRISKAPRPALQEATLESREAAFEFDLDGGHVWMVRR